jgi:two-component system chemotaxis sensor kinase CheA
MDEKKKILIIDDDELSLFVMARFFRGNDLEIITAKNGQEGLRKFIQNQKEIKIILTDLHMPFISGLDVVRVIEADTEARGEECPQVMFMTASIHSPLYDEVKENFSDSLYLKPLDLPKMAKIFRKKLSD